LAGNGIERAQAGLERAHPAWMVWVVYRPVGVPAAWCAQRWDGTGEAVSAGTAEQLGQAITRAEAEPG
jgi:hypothetical protein